LLQIWPLARLGLLPARFDWRDPGGACAGRDGSGVIGVSAAQISALINTQLASALGDGAIFWISSADRLMEFPSALLGVALGTVLLPSLAKHHADENTGEYSSLLDWGLRLAFLLALPAAVALCVLAFPLVTTMDQYGRFTVGDAMQTRDALLGYSVGLLGLIVVKILAPGFYARQIMKTPVKIAFFALLVAQSFAVFLMFRIGHAGLTLSTSIGACVNASLLFWFLRRRGIYVPQPGWPVFSRSNSSRSACSGCWLAPCGPGAILAARHCGRGSACRVIGAGGIAIWHAMAGFRLPTSTAGIVW
jgi:putative peptidoglycan lipid II flippase